MTQNKIKHRLHLILEMLKKQPSIKVSKFADEFNVTPKTVRNDLKILEEKGLVIRTFGFASLAPSAKKQILAKERQTLTTDELIAKKAVELIPENARYIGLDCGSSVSEVAKQIIDLPSVKTIVTGSVPAINNLADGHHQLICLGGVLDPVSHCFQWSIHDTLLDRINLDVTFFESSGVLKHNGPCANNFTDAAMKHQLLNRSSINVALISHELFAVTSLIEIAPWSSFNYVITDSKTPEDIIEKIRLKTDLIIV